jgi:hypothetical protein
MKYYTEEQVKRFLELQRYNCNHEFDKRSIYDGSDWYLNSDDVLNAKEPELIEGLEFEPDILVWIKTMFKHAEERQWDRVYFTFDLHGTISCPDYRKKIKKIKYYPYAKETLQLLTKRDDIKMILWSSSYPDELEIYKNQLEEDDIIFDFIGENPEISDAKGAFGYYNQKHYFNLLVEDKSGFNPNSWESLYNYFNNQTYRPDPSWSIKYDEKYHK